MTDHQPPPWDADSLSKYFADAEYNERVTAINYPDIYDLPEPVNDIETPRAQ